MHVLLILLVASLLAFSGTPAAAADLPATALPLQLRRPVPLFLSAPGSNRLPGLEARLQVPPGSPLAAAANTAGAMQGSPGALCRAAIQAASARYGIPAGLLAAIARVESGRRDPNTGELAPWPWTINAEGQGKFFETREEAVAWVRAAQQRGIRSIDTGCMQVNLLHHPGAFASIEEAFDPFHNADYAARFLRELQAGPAAGNWMRAAGYYHSQTPELASAYQHDVEAVLAGRSPSPMLASAASPAPSLPATPAIPASTGPVLSNHPERAAILLAQNNVPGKGLDAYRAAPVLRNVSFVGPRIIYGHPWLR